jgi:predicted RNA-binding Zn ribbon-like protein
MAEQLDTAKFYFVGNNLSIDFVNTQIIADGEPKDLLESFADFVDWAQAADLLSTPQAATVLENWGSKPQAAQSLKDAKAFRETLRKMIQQAATGAEIDAPIINAINQLLHEGNGYNELVRGENGFEKRFHTAFHPPRQLLAPIAAAAADLLCYGNPAYLRKCENPDCVLYFYDTTKNHRRRWCSMAACGNRAKAAAFYQRHSKKAKPS